MSEESTVISIVVCLIFLTVMGIIGYNAYAHSLVNKEIQGGVPAMVAACAHNTQPNGFDCRRDIKDKE